jgi:hypothetical protein
MKEKDNIIKSVNFAKKISSQLNISDSLLKIAQNKEYWDSKLNTVSMCESIIKSISYQQNLIPKNIIYLDSDTKNLGSQIASFKIPNETLESILEIGKMQASIFGDLKSISKIGEIYQPISAKMKSMQMAMRNISSQIATISAQNNNWGLLEEFERINEETIEITNNFTTDFTLTEDETKRFEEIIEKIILFFKSNKKYGTNVLLFISVLVNIMALHQYYDFLKSKPAATKEDLFIFGGSIIQEIESKLKEEKEYRTTNRISKVMIKPKTKTLLLNILPKRFDVIVLQINHKWVFVSYINPKDNLMETGWIMKKYLDKAK